MKQVILILCLLGLRLSARAQQEFNFNDEKSSYATVKDTDGFVNVRKAPNSNAPIMGKILNYNVFSCESNNTNWWKVLCVQTDNHTKSYLLEGYIYKSGVLLLSNWKAINKKTGLTLIVKKTPFNPQKHKLFYSKEDPSNVRSELKKIDSKFFWGTDGEIPKEVISNVEVIIKGSQVRIPKNAFDDLYGPHWGNINMCHGPDNTIYVSMSNSDGAGAYTVIWIIKDNKYYGRYIDDSMV